MTDKQTVLQRIGPLFIDGSDVFLGGGKNSICPAFRKGIGCDETIVFIIVNHQNRLLPQKIHSRFSWFACRTGRSIMKAGP